jgi:hypothetical protein
VIVTVVLALFAFAGASPLFFVQFEKLYHALVFAVALILTCFPYLYVFALSVFVHPLLTLLIHVHFVNVNVYVFLSYQHAYVVLLAFAVVALDALDVPGSHTLVIFLLLGIVGAVHKLLNVKLVPLCIT